MNTPSPTQRLASILLGEPVTTWVARQRSAGRSWRLVARDLYERTGGQIDVTHETLRLWVPEDRPLEVHR
jgi:hypothetical protein